MKKKTIRTRVASAVVAAILALTGCGSATASTTIEDDTEALAGEVQSTEADTTEQAAEEETVEVRQIHVATGANTHPWTYYDEDNNLTGYDVEVLKAVFDRLPQYELVWEITEFGSIFTGIDAGYYQMGCNNIILTDERKEKYLYTLPKSTSIEALVSSTFEFEKDVYTFEDLSEYDLTFIYEPTTHHTTFLKAWNEEHPDKAINIDFTEEGTPSILQNIESGKYEIYSLDRAILLAYDKELGGLNVNTATLDFLRGPSYGYFITAGDEEQLRDDYNVVLRELVADGTMTELALKYIGEDLVPYEAYE